METKFQMENGMSSFDDWIELALLVAKRQGAERVSELKKIIEEAQKPKTFEEQLAEEVKRANESVGHLNEEDGYDCPFCKNKGYTMKVSPDEYGYLYKVATPCKCMKIRANAKRLKRSGLAEWVDSKTFDTFIVAENWQENMKSKALGYIKNPSGWLYVAGQSGAGKTHICTATCLKLIEMGKSVKYLLWSEIICKLESTRFDDSKRANFINDIAKNDIIYIDDFMKCFNKERHLGLTFEFINKMIVMKKTLVISSETFCKEITDIDEALGGRIAEKTRGHIIQIAKNPDRNYRFK